MSMTLRNNMLPLILQQLCIDKRIMHSDFRVYTHCFLAGPGTAGEHSKTSGIPVQTIRRSVERLVKYGWVVLRTETRGKIIIPWMPAEVEEIIVSQLSVARDLVSYTGEWLMKCLLDLLGYDRRCFDNARPHWLVTGDGSGRLELDRWYYGANVAFEFQGPQHYRITPMTPTQADLDNQIKRDHIKASLCNKQGITLIPIRASELSVHSVKEKISGRLPLSGARENGPLMRYIANLCASYVNHANRSAEGT